MAILPSFKCSIEVYVESWKYGACPSRKATKKRKSCVGTAPPQVKVKTFFYKKTIDILAQLDFIEVKKDKQAIRTNYETHIFFSSGAVKTSRHL